MLVPKRLSGPQAIKLIRIYPKTLPPWWYPAIRQGAATIGLLWSALEHRHEHPNASPDSLFRSPSVARFEVLIGPLCQTLGGRWQNDFQNNPGKTLEKWLIGATGFDSPEWMDWPVERLNELIKPAPTTPAIPSEMLRSVETRGGRTPSMISSSNDDDYSDFDTQSGDLFAFLDLAEIASANSQNVLNEYLEKPRYTTSSNSEAIRRAQKRASARHALEYQAASIRRIRKACAGAPAMWSKGAYSVRRGAIQLGNAPVFVDGQSYPTAHEAAFALGEFVLDAWDSTGGDWAVENAPDRMHAESDGDDADLARKMRFALWRKFSESRDRLPPDLWGQIQQEFHAAEEWLMDVNTPPASPSGIATIASPVVAAEVPNPPSKGRGRPRRNDPDDERILAAWDSGHHASYQDCAEVLELKKWNNLVPWRRVERCVDAQRKRTERQKKPP